MVTYLLHIYGLTPIHNQICDSRFPAAAGGSSSGLILIGKDALRRQGTTSRCCCIVAWASEVGQREQHQCFQIFFVGILIQARITSTFYETYPLLRDIFYSVVKRREKKPFGASIQPSALNMNYNKSAFSTHLEVVDNRPSISTSSSPAVSFPAVQFPVPQASRESRSRAAQTRAGVTCFRKQAGSQQTDKAGRRRR